MTARPLRFFTLSLIALALIAPAAPAQTAEDLVEQVVIRRTEYGVPHILARSPKAMGFGLAYAQAEDHMEKIAKLIITARGERTKYFGYNDRNLESDFRQLQYRIPQRAQETYNYLDPEWRDVTEGFALGLNYYIELHRDELPDWVQPVSQYDVAAHGLSGVARLEWRPHLANWLVLLQKIRGCAVRSPPLTQRDPFSCCGREPSEFRGDRCKSANLR